MSGWRSFGEGGVLGTKFGVRGGGGCFSIKVSGASIQREDDEREERRIARQEGIEC